MMQCLRHRWLDHPRRSIRARKILTLSRFGPHSGRVLRAPRGEPMTLECRQVVVSKASGLRG